MCRYSLMDAWHWTSCLYFVTFVFLVAFFVVNLALAVIENIFATDPEEPEPDSEELRAEKEEQKAASMVVNQVGPKPKRKSQMFEYMERRRQLARMSSFWQGKAVAADSWALWWRRSWLVRTCKWVCKHSNFEKLFLLAIVGNTITMAAQHHGMSQQMTDILYICNLVFTVLFTVEMLIMQIGQGCKRYWAVGFNAFDGTFNLYRHHPTI